MAERFVEVDGLDRLRRLLRAAPPELRTQLRKANKGAAEIVRDEARRIVPHRTGQLQRSIAAMASLKDASVKAGSASRVPYAGPVHFGWPNRPNRQRRWRGGPIRPQPFLYAAADSRIEAVRNRYDEALTGFVNTIDTI